MRPILIFILGLFLATNTAFCQDSLQVVEAKAGDGIFSILRKEGMNPSKYYAAFVELNATNIKNGSELHVGRKYKLPNAPDSFKNVGRYVMLSTNTERPIFDAELVSMNLKSEKLQKAVYYLISEDSEVESKNKTEKFTDDIALNLAKRLLENGATVYLINEVPSEEESIEDMQAYVSAINERYLKHLGKYQRLLIVKSNGLTSHRRLNVSIYHHDKSEDGQRLADNIQNVFQKNSVKEVSAKDGSEVFEDKNSLFLAKNALPALTVVEVGNSDVQENKKVLSVRPDKNALAKWLSNGIFKDYADLEIED